jgi:hypothetical protein
LAIEGFVVCRDRNWKEAGARKWNEGTRVVKPVPRELKRSANREPHVAVL